MTMITAATTTTKRVANKDKIVGNENGFSSVTEAVFVYAPSP
jgi:hypothetical protein